MPEVASPMSLQLPRPEVNGTPGRKENSARGPQWTGHRTFLSIYNEGLGGLFNGNAEASRCTGDAQGGGIAWLWMVIWCNCFIFMGMSLQGIAFTGLARSRGLSSFETGIIHGCSRASIVLGALLAHFLLSVIYPAYLLITGMVLHATAIAALGALHWLPDDQNLFLGVGAALKCVAGIGFAIYFATMYTILFYKHQQSFMVTLIVSEVAVGVGGVIGPIVGFELTQVWLYPLPFFAIGGCMLLGILIAVALPLDACVPREKSTRINNDCSSLGFLGDVRFWVDIVTAALSGATMAHFETTLELHLSTITESEYHINYSYSMIYGSYAIGAVLFGFTSSLPKAEAFVVFAAQLVSAVAFLFVGPAQFLSLPTNLWLTRLGIGLAGLAAAGQFVPVIARVVRSATWPDRAYDLRIISLAVCAVLVMLHCGALVLSLVSGYVTDNKGSVAPSTVMLTIQASWTLVRFLVWITEMTIGKDTFLS